MKFSQGDRGFQAFEAQIAASANHQLVPVNISETYRWALAPGLPKLRLQAE